MVGFQIDLELHEMITNLELGEATLLAHVFDEIRTIFQPPDILANEIRTEVLT